MHLDIRTDIELGKSSRLNPLQKNLMDFINGFLPGWQSQLGQLVFPLRHFSQEHCRPPLLPLVVILLTKTGVGHSFLEITLRVEPLFIRAGYVHLEGRSVRAGVCVVGVLVDMEMKNIA